MPDAIGPPYATAGVLPLTPGIVVFHTRWPSASNTSTAYWSSPESSAQVSIGALVTASAWVAPGDITASAPVTLNVPAAAVCPAATWTCTSAVPLMQWSGSRTRPSFSNAATTTYLPGGTPSIVNAPVMLGGPLAGARIPGGGTPRPVSGSNVDSTNATTEVPVALPPSTRSTWPLSEPGLSVDSARSSLVSPATSIAAGA